MHMSNEGVKGKTGRSGRPGKDLEGTWEMKRGNLKEMGKVVMRESGPNRGE